MITLTLNGAPLPAILTANLFIELAVRVDGEHPLYTEWSVWTSTLVAMGTGSPLAFRPTQTAVHYLSVYAVDGAGRASTQSFSVQVLERQASPVVLAVDWTKNRYLKTETLRAQIRFVDPQGLAYQSLHWNLYRNSTWRSSGVGTLAVHPEADHGVYRIVATAVDYYGNTITGESSVVVGGSFEVQATLRPVNAGRTMQFLGSAYTGEQRGDAALSTAIGMAWSAMAEEIYLLPGTTHFQVELDPSELAAPGQVVVRTPTGNWSVKGQPPRMIDLPYEFLDNTHFIPAPADLRLRLFVESYATSIGVQAGFHFRVKINCFYDGRQVYQFRACARTQATGGSGPRARRFAVIFSQVDLLTDTDTTANRMGIPSGQAQRYLTELPELLSIPLSVDGTPDQSDPARRASYTDQNWTVAYDPVAAGAKGVDAHSTYAIEQCRPFVTSFMMPGYPTIIQRPRRLSGTVGVYLANGHLNAGAEINLSLLSAGGFSARTVAVPVDEDAYSPDQTRYVKVGEAELDLSDSEFIDNGLVGFVNVDESGASAESWPVGEIQPDPVILEGTIYSTSSAAFARLDGACYYNEGAVAVMTGTHALDATGTAYPLVPDIVACFDPLCGPVGLYCYGENNGTTTLHVPQPLYYPAPYVAPADQVTRCYCNPCLLETWIGTNGTLPAYPAFVAYQDGSYCGVPWSYHACNGTSASLVIPYPTATVPPGYVAYAGTCYNNQGQLTYTTGYTLVGRNAVSPVFDCQDAVCTGSIANGNVVRYRDHETQRDVDVYFEHLDAGVPQYGVIRATIDDGLRGLSAGCGIVSITRQESQQWITTVVGTGVLEVIVTPVGGDRQILRYRDGTATVYDLNSGVSGRKIPVVPGDRLVLRAYAPKRKQFTVNWRPFVPRPRLYASGTVAGSFNSRIRAVGFSGLTDRSEYQFYGTLPADLAVSEVNPDTILTVVSQGQEYALLRVRGVHDPACALPTLYWYGSTQTLPGPLEFRLYAGRETTGQNGDLDVWLDFDGTFPAAFSVSLYQGLIRPGNPPRTNRTPDAERNSLRVISTSQLPQHRWPSAYIASDGDRIVVATATRPATASFFGTTYGWAGTCPGLAFHILEG